MEAFDALESAVQGTQPVDAEANEEARAASPPVTCARTKYLT